MKKGFIENIENNLVSIVFEDKTEEDFPISLFPKDIKLDMVVLIDNEKITVLENDKQIENEIKEIKKEIFVSFKERNNRKKSQI